MSENILSKKEKFTLSKANGRYSLNSEIEDRQTETSKEQAPLCSTNHFIKEEEKLKCCSIR